MVKFEPAVEFKNIEKAYSAVKKESAENMRKITTAMARKVPRIVGKRVAERYSIPASEIYPPAYKVKTDRKTGAKTRVKKAGSVKVTGETLDELTFTWESRRLTVQRFKMKPSAVPKNPHEPYDITFSVLRGSRQTLGRTDKYRFFIQNLHGVVQALYATNDRSSALNRKIAGVAKTLSVPIMIDNSNIKDKWRADINSELELQIKKLR